MSLSGMFFAGLIMITKNRYLAWPAVVLSIMSVINQHPLRQKEVTGAFSGIGCVPSWICPWGQR